MNEKILEEDAFLVSETDEKGIITFANEDFCKMAGYELSELLGQPHNIIRNLDMPKIAFKTLWDTITKGEVWTGFVKNLAKCGSYYWVFATVYPFVSCGGKKGYLSCRRKPTKEEIDTHEALYKQWKREE